MHSRTVGIGLLLAMVGVTSAMAEDGDSAEGQKLYNKECSVCHGVISRANTSDAAPAGSRLRPVRVAVAPSAEFTTVDFQVPLSSDWREAGAGHESRRDRTTPRDLLAVVPLYGPPLGPCERKPVIPRASSRREPRSALLARQCRRHSCCGQSWG